MTTTPLTQRSRAALALALAAATGVSVLAPAAPAAGPLQRVVVTGPSVQSVVDAVEHAGGRILARLPLLSGVTAELPTTAELPYSVVPDRALTTSGATAAPTGPVSTVRATLGLGAPSDEGRGVRVAVVDSGVADVADLRGRVTHVDVTDPDTQAGAGTDRFGHGTFVAGLVAGNGAQSGGDFAGVAPGASVLDVKVAGDDGSTSLVQVLRGLQAVADDGDVDVLNLSLSSHSPLPYQVDPLTQALERLWERGVVVVVPAGNDGPGEATVSSPGVDPVLLTVGGLLEHATADRSDDAVAAWSARGPAPQGVAKPDLAAPGGSVVSTLSAGSVAAAAQTRTDLPAGYAVGSGTSFATAVTSGAAAALLGRRDLTPDQVKALLTSTAYDLGTATSAGAGGLDLGAALTARTPDVASVRLLTPSNPGASKKWFAVLDALLDRDHVAAERAWDKLGKKEQAWAASNWATVTPAASNWAASMWAGLGWGPGSEQWQGRVWAASNWAASNWAANSWSANSWSASNWAANSWSASNWAASNWASVWSASNWAANSWSASNWAANSWSASNWAANSWSASNWAASNWAASNWAASNWAASNWAASNWAGSSWS